MEGATILFLEIGAIVVVAFLLGLLAKSIRQPLLIAYIMAGFFLGPSFFGFVADRELIGLFSTIGVAFLLFAVGLEMNISKLKEIGVQSFIIGVLQMGATFTFGYLIANLLGFSALPSLYIGVGLAFSSTIVVVKLLSEKRTLSSFYGRVVLGVLLTQDIVALLILVLLAGLGQGVAVLSWMVLGKIIIRGIALSVAIYIFSHFILKKLFRYLGSSGELFFIASIAWCFAVAIAFVLSGFSLEMGAFVAGISLASLPYGEEISSRLVPLRDFFLVLFFVALGMQIDIGGLDKLAAPIIIITLLATIIKPLIVMTITGFFNFTKRISFYSGISLGQISEFSLIIFGVGLSLDHINQRHFSIIVVASVLSIIFSSYAITFLGYIFVYLQKIFGSVLSGKDDEKKINRHKNHILLFGYHRVGSNIMKSLKKIAKDILVVEIDPVIIEELLSREIPCVYGDAYDLELLDRINLSDAKMVVITIPAKKSNIFLIKKIRAVNKKATIVTMAEQSQEAIELYQSGSDYVVLPHYISADYLSGVLAHFGRNKSKIKNLRAKHLSLLKGLAKTK